MGWLDEQPVDADIGLCYPAVYYTHHTDGESNAAEEPGLIGLPGLQGRLRDMILAGRYGYDVPGIAPMQRYLGRLLGMIGPIRYRVAYRADHALPVWRRGGRLLDIGCGAGDYLGFARRLGWQTYGLDPDPAAVEVARRRGATVVQGTLDTVRLPDAPFDAVASMHSIEHARNPRDFLRNALALLRPGGFFYLQTPNFHSLMHRRFGADWYALEVSRHLCLLSVPALRRLLTELGSWSTLIVRSNPRRAVREQEQTVAMRRSGSFEAQIAYSLRDRLGMRSWALLETLGNGTFHWGEEVEVIGFKAE